MKNFPILSAEDLKEILPSKDDLSHVKILTYSGEAAYFYCVGKVPILFSRGSKLYPTLHLLWRYPNIAPYFSAATEVLPVLQGGADFMTAGIMWSDPKTRFGRVSKNDTVYVNLCENKAAVAVGEAALSSHDMYMSGGRGKCVIVLHVYEDELCKFGGSVPLPRLEPALIKVTDESPVGSDESDSVVLSFANAVKSNGVVEQGDVETPSSAATVVEEGCEQFSEEDFEKSNKELASADDVITYCFLKALNTSVKNVKLPLLTSNFYKLHMIPSCPEGKTIDIKKTRFKKMSKFIQEMAADNVIKFEESSPGVQSITQINYSHHLISGFVDDQVSSDGRSKSEGKTDLEPKVCEKYTVTAAVLPIFSEFLMK